MSERDRATRSAAPGHERVTVARNPWRKPRILQGVTIGYLLWSLAAGRDRRDLLVQRRTFAHLVAGVLAAVVDAGPDRLAPDTTRRCAPRWRRRTSLAIITVLIAVPLGTLFAIGIDRWHGRPAAGRELHDAAVVRGARDHPRRLALHPVHATCSRGSCRSAHRRRCWASSRFQLSATPSSSCAPGCSRSGPSTRRRRWTWARTPSQAIRRVLLPLLSPAILASVALVFADVGRRLRDRARRCRPRRAARRCPEDLLGLPRRRRRRR